tara:strand:+ start:970 stop:1761 length:792 start_codon:yes stop_codon:yes gene_type:complete
MGYDITVKRTKFHRWFSVWDWHRCIASAIFGLGEIDDKEYRNELYAVNDLQRNGLVKNEEKEEWWKPTDDEINIKAETKDVDKVIIEVKIDYDNELRAIGAMAAIPVPEKMAEAPDFNPKEFAESISGTVAIQVRTNNLLHDHKKRLKLTNEQCKLLSCMDGENIDREVSLLLAVGLGCCLEIATDGGGIGQAWQSMMDDMNMPERIQRHLFGPILEAFDVSSKQELSFEIMEYMEPEQLGSLASALALVVDAVFSGSDIVIE